MALDVRDVTL